MCITDDHNSLRFFLLSFDSTFIFIAYLIYFYYLSYAYFDNILSLPADIIVKNTADVLHTNRDRFDDLFTHKTQFVPKCWRLFRDLVWPRHKGNIYFKQKPNFFPIIDRKLRGRAFAIEFLLEVTYLLMGSMFGKSSPCCLHRI